MSCCGSCCPPVCPPCSLNCVRRIKSRELIGGILYTQCECPRRNGLQDSCPRTGCGIPACTTLPLPCCCPGRRDSCIRRFCC
ncbi:sperm mitochondrial-associated cysteine-rich protein-like [Bacillus rossius redtenbacheri]|uniref:sperm mitochondrial-associated cysteine-rich protein-like n=1 Tax=Bacillus rossius redtenbacheri TaxID=93214 RepID=UPI002FDD8887